MEEKDLQQGPGRIRTRKDLQQGARTRENQDKVASQAEPGEDQRAQIRVKRSSIQKGEPGLQGRVASDPR